MAPFPWVRVRGPLVINTAIFIGSALVQKALGVDILPIVNWGPGHPGWGVGVNIPYGTSPNIIVKKKNDWCLLQKQIPCHSFFFIVRVCHPCGERAALGVLGPSSVWDPARPVSAAQVARLSP